ncbi:MAG: sulfite exporter TauE/SafE family protein [Flavobacteriales bacterium]
MSIFLIENIEWFLFILPCIAFLYSSVGHGGASGYLALMAIFSFPTIQMKPIALVLNLVVAGIAFIQYYRNGFFNLKLFLSFALASIPLSFLGGLIQVESSVYKGILALFLVFSILKMLNILGFKTKEEQAVNIKQALIIGGIVGFFSGLIGIGGGIILSPIILLLGWGKTKVTAGVSALFIWVNSAAGLLGQFNSGIHLPEGLIWLVILAILGGFLGSYFGSFKWSQKTVKYILTAVLISACIKLSLF